MQERRIEEELAGDSGMATRKEMIRVRNLIKRHASGPLHVSQHLIRYIYNMSVPFKLPNKIKELLWLVATLKKIDPC